MVTPTKQNPNIDEQWFKDKLQEKQLTIRGIAKLMGVHPSTVSLMLRGLRQIQQDDAVKLSDLLSVPVVEIFRRAGAPIKDEQRKIKVLSYCDQEGEHHYIDPDVADSFVAPYDTPTNAYGLQIRTGRKHDGWMLIVAGNKVKPETCVGKFAVYCTENGNIYVGMIRRGYKEGTYNATNEMADGGHTTYQNLNLVWCQEVVWIKPNN